MGLTIHYALRAKPGSGQQVREVLERLRGRALDLPFAKVGELIEVSGAECRCESLKRDDPRRWLLTQAGHYIERSAPDGGQSWINVPPRHVLAFSAWPGEGCEEANFGLCRYPATVAIAADGPKRAGLSRLRTGLTGWRWRSFCKTQYASNPEAGGAVNFLRCHLLVIQMLDQARGLGILESVKDEGDYWERRDPQALVKEVGNWNEMVAAAFGELKDRFDQQVVSPIGLFPNFEHLEAKGRNTDRKDH